jgi:hypothetical protein
MIDAGLRGEVDRRPALMYSALRGNVEQVRILINSGAKIDLKDYEMDDLSAQNSNH